MKRKELFFGSAGLSSGDAKILVQAACRFRSQISIEVGNKRVNAKSMMGILAISSVTTPVIIEIDGEDEDAAIAELTRVSNEEIGKN